MAGAERSRWIADRLAGARADVERIAGELVRGGRLTAIEAAAIGDAVERAIDEGRTLLDEALREPRRILASLRGAAVDAPAAHRPDQAHDARQHGAAADEVAARIARLEARVAALEALLADRSGGRDEGEGI